MPVAAFPMTRPSRSTLSLVMIETIFAPSAMLISTSAFTAPLATAETVPAMQFRADILLLSKSTMPITDDALTSASAAEFRSSPSDVALPRVMMATISRPSSVWRITSSLTGRDWTSHRRCGLRNDYARLFAYFSPEVTAPENWGRCSDVCFAAFVLGAMRIPMGRGLRPPMMNIAAR